MKLNEIKHIYRTPLCESQNLADFTQNIQTMLQRKNFLFRGISKHDGMQPANIPNVDAYYTQPRETERTAKGNALAGAIVSRMPGIPNRGMSNFVTGKETHAGKFGTVMVCVPADSTNSFAYTSTDFNYLDNVEELQPLNMRLAYLFQDTGAWMDDTNYTGDELDEMRKLYDAVPLDADKWPRFASPEAIKFFDYAIEMIPKMAVRETRFRELLVSIPPILNRMQEYHADKFSQLFKGFSPNFFDIQTATRLSEIPGGVGEVWFTGAVLMIEMGDDSAEDVLRNVLSSMKGA